MSVFVEKFVVEESTNLTVAVKDNIDVKGFVTQAGSEAYANNNAAEENATIVESILNAGCKLVGKLNMHELAFGMTGVNAYFGTPINHHFPHYITGGSSSGCAVAVADGSVDFSIGTDTGGSIRVPAACCGVFGLKPTFGRISRKGITPADSTLDCVGPFAASAATLIDAMKIIDSTFETIKLPESICLGQVNVNAEKKIITAVNNEISKDFITLKNIELPSLDDAFKDALALMNAEMWLSFGSLLNTNKLGEDVAKRLLAAKDTSVEALEKAEKTKNRFTEEVDKALQSVDALVLPALASFPLSREDALAGKSDLTISSLTRPFNLSGHPAIIIPVQNNLGKPIAIQLVGAKGQDELICGIAKKISESSSINIPMLEKNNV
ncbi:amidase [Pseudocolwellia sp. HL-MZ19]|uniref:amidase n=1 Tax=Pseudocolwellia sp. HL-MZ19 TaxID=3400846 RepID=UPI003CF5FCCA